MTEVYDMSQFVARLEAEDIECVARKHEIIRVPAAKSFAGQKAYGVALIAEKPDEFGRTVKIVSTESEDHAVTVLRERSAIFALETPAPVKAKPAATTPSEPVTEKIVPKTWTKEDEEKQTELLDFIYNRGDELPTPAQLEFLNQLYIIDDDIAGISKTGASAIIDQMVPVQKEIVADITSKDKPTKPKAAVNVEKLQGVIKEEVSACVAKVLARATEYAA